MRKLQLFDVFALGRVLDKAGCREDIRELIEASATVKTAKDMETNGYNLLFGVFTKLCARAQDDVCAFLAGPFEVTPDDVLHMEFDELAENFKQLARENDLTAFFTRFTAVQSRKPSTLSTRNTGKRRKS